MGRIHFAVQGTLLCRYVIEMALTITKLKMWKDPGYTRNCLEVPPAGSLKLPAVPDYTLAADETLRPHKGSTLTELHLPLSFTQTFGMSYLYIEATDGAGSVSLFGWITSIEQRSTAAEGVTIRWDVDWWRSYSGSITWGSGVVTRCNDSTYKRPYPTHPRKWKVSRMVPFAQSGGTPSKMWCCVVFNQSSGGTTTVNHYCWQMGATMTDGGIDYTGLTIQQVMQGIVDEAFTAITSPSSITGIFITPFQPHAGTIHYVNVAGIGNIWYWEGYGSSTATGTWTSGTEFFTDDMNEAVIVDPYGAIVGRIPYGVKVDSYKIYSDIGTSDLRTMLCLGDANDSTDAEKAGPLGRVISLSPLTAPVNSNAWSDYNYSGQRDYDKRNAELQRNETRVKSYLGGGESMIGGAAAGGLATKGSPAGATAGLVASTGLTFLSTEINYAMQGGLDDEYQKAKDKLYQNQASNLLISGGGMGFTNMLNQWYWVQLTADDVSAAEYSNDVTLNGYETDVPTSSVSSFITGGGPLQIINVNLTGNAPPQAKQFIKNKLQSGVYIVENNPSGVAP